jgi:hypothetical protein
MVRLRSLLASMANEVVSRTQWECTEMTVYPHVYLEVVLPVESMIYCNHVLPVCHAVNATALGVSGSMKCESRTSSIRH